MHQPRPYGLHAIGLPLTENDEAFVASVTNRITNLKELSKVDSMKMVYDLPDGGYVIVQDMGGNFRVISHKPIHGKDPIFDGIATDYIPMLFSGVFVRSIVHANEPAKIKLTEKARFRLVNYKYLEKKPPKEIELHRFVIEYASQFAEFKTTTPSELTRTQYHQLRSTWYSGLMAEVVQIVSGYGRQDFANLPDEKVNEFERARVVLPPDVMESINKELESTRLPGYTGLPPDSGQIQFDYKFNSNNNIGLDGRGLPWLLRMDRNGVWAMPLPIIPATRTVAFKRYMHLMGDDEILAILERFGGMPSGESFPTGKAFEAWRKAGVIIKVCDTADFYNRIAYSSALGWSMNELGNEAYNTCYDYYDDEGLGYGLTYKLSLRLAYTEEYYGEKKVELVERGPIADKVRAYLSNLIPTLSSGTSEARAVLYKLRRANSELIYQRALGRTGKDDKEYWENLELEPIAAHAGTVTEVSRGYLYHPSKFEHQPQIKFPEPLINGCLSHNFLPLENGRYKDKYPNSDTIMFAYYVGNSIKTIKYFIEWGGFESASEDNYEKYMYVGSWYKRTRQGPTHIQGFFYSSDIDDREFVAPTETSTTIEGTDLGFDSVPFFSFDGVFAMSGTIFRNRYYKHVVNTVERRGRSITLGVCIPYFCRDMSIYAKQTYIEIEVESSGVSMGKVQDPNVYRFWTYDPVWAWDDMTIRNPQGDPFPKHGNPVWVEEHQYGPTQGNAFADNGDFIGGLPADYTWLVHPQSNVWAVNGGGGAPTIDNTSTRTNPVSKTTGSISVSVKGYNGLMNNNVPRGGYFIASPTPGGGVFTVGACAVSFGVLYGNVEEQNLNGGRGKWGYCSLVNDKSTYCFIGVINE